MQFSGPSLAFSEVARKISGKIRWDSKRNRALLESKSKKVIVTLENRVAYINGSPYKMDFPAYIKKGEVHIPFSFYELYLKEVPKKSPQKKPTELSAKKKPKVELSVKPDPQIEPTPKKKIETKPKKKPSKKNVKKIKKKPVGGHVVLDAGHGGKDPGALGIIRKYKEKYLALAIAQEVRKLLVKAGVKVTMTRTRDVFLQLDTRAKMANKVKGDCFVSIHLNSTRNHKISGFEVFIHKKRKGARARKSWSLAYRIWKRLHKNTPLKDRRIRRANFRVLAKTKMPAVLLEYGYLSNQKELKWILKKENQDLLAKQTAEGIISFLKKIL